MGNYNDQFQSLRAHEFLKAFDRALKLITKSYHLDQQKLKTIEECAELIKALSDGRLSYPDVASELADVYIMIHQMMIYYGFNIAPLVLQKLDRQQERIENDPYRK